MKKFTSALIVAMIVAVFAVSTVFAGYTFSATLYAGQTNAIAGYVKISNDADNLYVDYWMKGGAGWCISEAHVHAASSLDGFPTNGGGNVIPGQFDFKAGLGGCLNQYTFVIPLADLADKGIEPGDEFFLAVHAVVFNKFTGEEETGWAVRCGNLADVQFSGPGWTAYIVFTQDAWN